MISVAILGAGPAACLLAMALRALSIKATIIGSERSNRAVEGVSPRVVEALERLGFGGAIARLGSPWEREAHWNGRISTGNREYLVERVYFDELLRRSASEAGVRVSIGIVRDIGQRSDGSWEIFWSERNGDLRHLDATIVVECRGSLAPRVAQDQHALPIRIALSRTYISERAQKRMTFVESYREGWAWGSIDETGATHIQLTMLANSLKANERDMDQIHADGVQKLEGFLDRVGQKIRPSGPVRVRGVQPMLRGSIVGRNYLRVGDAAYSVDPLSGHGIFEAVSGAMAAAPVINTILHRPQDCELANDYFESRMKSLYFSRVRTAVSLYKSEERWRDHSFWTRLSSEALIPKELAESRFVPSFREAPVVEDGFIVRRKIVVNNEFPRGVRFIDGVELHQLSCALQTFGSDDLDSVCRCVEAQYDSVRRAVSWLRSQGLVCDSVTHSAPDEGSQGGESLSPIPCPNELTST